jgi:uncharacterized RDD family membrane protein YckC
MLLKRAVAIIIDTIIVGIIPALLGAVVDQSVSGLVAFLIGIIYQWYFLTRNEGQTPGKQIMGIRVVSMDGGPVGDVSAALRYVGYYLNTIVLFLGWILAIVTGRGFHDYIANTQVVDA